VVNNDGFEMDIKDFDDEKVFLAIKNVGEYSRLHKTELEHNMLQHPVIECDCGKLCCNGCGKTVTKCDECGAVFYDCMDYIGIDNLGEVNCALNEKKHYCNSCAWGKMGFKWDKKAMQKAIDEMK